MASATLTLSRALRMYIAATGKTLQDVERNAFVESNGGLPIMGGAGYLRDVYSGIVGSQGLANTYESEGAKLLATFLITELAHLPSPQAQHIADKLPSTVINNPVMPADPRHRRTRKRRDKPAPKHG